MKTETILWIGGGVAAFVFINSLSKGKFAESMGKGSGEAMVKGTGSFFGSMWDWTKGFASAKVISARETINIPEVNIGDLVLPWKYTFKQTELLRQKLWG